MMENLSIVRLLVVCLVACIFPVSASAQVVELLPLGHTWKFFRGITAPSSPDETAWRMPIFADNTWEMGATSIGYGDDDDVTVIDDMEGNYASIYFRTVFEVTNVSSITSLLLSFLVDDGMVVYLNGDEVFRFALGAPLTELTFEDFAGSHDAGSLEYADVSISLPSLLEGENVLAVEVHNATLDSSDLTFNLRVTGNDPRGSCPTGLACATRNSGVMITWNNTLPYDSIALTKNSVHVAGSPFPGNTSEFFDDSPGDYASEYELTATLNGVACDTISGSSQPFDIELIEIGDEWRFFRGTQAPSDPITAWRHFDFIDSQWEIGATIIGYGDDDDATVLDDMMGNYRAVFLRKIFTLPDPAFLRNMLLFVNYDDGYIAYVDGVEVARSSSMGDPGQEFAFDQAADSDHEASGEERTDLSALLSSLSAGDHVLAVEAHNASLSSSDLSISAEIDVNACLIRLTCTADDETGNVILGIRSLLPGPIAITRNGDPLPGSPFASGTTEVIDTSPGVSDIDYSMTVLIGERECPASECSITCDDREGGQLTCELSLVDGVTQALLSWQTPANTESIDITREDDLIDTLLIPQDSYFDPNVESLEPEHDVHYLVKFNLTDGSTCTISCPEMSLCPQNLTCEIVDGDVVLTWDNILKNWSGFTINRDGAPIASIDGDRTSFTDDTVVFLGFQAVDYEVIPVAPVGEEVLGCDQSCSAVPTVTEDARYETNGLTYFLDFSVGQDAYVPNRGDVGNLDGNWVRDLTQDFWDGSDPLTSGDAPDGEAPGGMDVRPVVGQNPCLSDGSVLRMLDAGNPGALGPDLTSYVDPHNASFMLGLPTGVTDRNLLRDGVTFVARWRLNPDPPVSISDDGDPDGHPVEDGLGQIGFVHINDGSLTTGASASVSFSMDSEGDLELSMDPLVDAPLARDTFVTVWVTVQDPEADETYEVTTYVNGLLIPFPELSVSGAALQAPVADFGVPTGNYLVLGAPSAMGDSDVEIDFIGYAQGVVTPTQAVCDDEGELFRRGDGDTNGNVNINDPITNLTFQFLGGITPLCRDALDTDDSGTININDPIVSLTFQFLGGVVIPLPGRMTCGVDPTDDNLDCAGYPPGLCP